MDPAPRFIRISAAARAGEALSEIEFVRSIGIHPARLDAGELSLFTSILIRRAKLREARYPSEIQCRLRPREIKRGRLPTQSPCPSANALWLKAWIPKEGVKITMEQSVYRSSSHVTKGVLREADYRREAQAMRRSSLAPFDHASADLFATRIVVADDDPVIRKRIVDYLESYGVRARAASGSIELEREMLVGEPSLIIFDIQLGHTDSFSLLRKLRFRSDVPIIVTIGHGCDEIDRAVGLELGADDYVTKPLNLRELLARIRAVLRRRENVLSSPKRKAMQLAYRFGGWHLSSRIRKLTDPDGCRVALTKGEYAMLMAFLEAPQRILTREHLLRATHVHEDVFDRSIDVQILRLRRKLKTDPSAPQIIQTERGIGYIFALTVETC
jgi:two-component system OmpR family response regulator